MYSENIVDKLFKFDQLTQVCVLMIYMIPDFTVAGQKTIVIVVRSIHHRLLSFYTLTDLVVGPVSYLLSSNNFKSQSE